MTNSADTPVVVLESAGVHYALPQERIQSFKEYILRRLRGAIGKNRFWALQEVNLSVPAGEMLGIVGRNGAGKSTLLKLLSRVERPSAGRVVVRGNVAPLLELGAGFHPDLTGRESLRLAATLFGHSERQVDAAFDEIVAFSGLGLGFIDLPIRNYSSGMIARLAFATATQFRPDVLLLDEVLSVGDTGFQQQSFERIAEFRSRGTTILFVSHDLPTVESQCDRVAWLEEGELKKVGPPGEIIEQYREAVTRS